MGSGRAAGWTLGERLRTIRASLARTQPGQIYVWVSCVARQPPGALAERQRDRALAGCSGGASGPCRPGLEDAQKVITNRPTQTDADTTDADTTDAGRAPRSFKTRWMIHLKGCGGDTEPAHEVGQGPVWRLSARARARTVSWKTIVHCR